MDRSRHTNNSQVVDMEGTEAKHKAAEAARQEQEKKAEALELDLEFKEMPMELDAEIKKVMADSERAMEDLAHGDAAGFIEQSREFAGNTFKGAACSIIESMSPGAVFAAAMAEQCLQGDEQEKDDIRKQIEQSDD